jgi:23S rRNA (pseudouridine1915-N3)-methyltransferase
MKIALVVVGKTQSKEVASLIADYSKRIAHYTGFEMIEAEEKTLEKTLNKYDRICLLEEIGKPLTSREFAGFVENQMAQGISSLAFVVGGPFGFAPEIKALADSNMSLSRMTFPHDLVRVIFLEQLYRAFTIMRNEKYHHD